MSAEKAASNLCTYAPRPPKKNGKIEGGNWWAECGIIILFDTVFLWQWLVNLYFGCGKINPKDKIYHEILTAEVDKYFSQPVDKLKSLNDFGSMDITKNGLIIGIGWWKYKISNDTYHFVFKTLRCSFIFQIPFLDGFKIVGENIERLNRVELGDYD